MRVWIYSEGRYGDSDETRWAVEIAIDPTPEKPWDDYAIERIEYELTPFKSKLAAMRGAKKLKSNYCNVAAVFRQALEQIEGDVFEWRDVSEREHVDCTYEPSKCDSRAA